MMLWVQTTWVLVSFLHRVLVRRRAVGRLSRASKLETVLQGRTRRLDTGVGSRHVRDEKRRAQHGGIHAGADYGHEAGSRVTKGQFGRCFRVGSRVRK